MAMAAAALTVEAALAASLVLLLAGLALRGLRAGATFGARLAVTITATTALAAAITAAALTTATAALTATAIAVETALTLKIGRMFGRGFRRRINGLFREQIF